MSIPKRPRDFAVERLRWMLVAALSGTTAGTLACSVASDDLENEGEAGAGNTSGAAGSGGSGGSGGTGSSTRVCEPMGESDGNFIRCEGGWIHREVPGTCSVPERVAASEGNVAGEGGGGSQAFPLPTDAQCTDDFDCDEAPNGFCVLQLMPLAPPATRCTYACTEDGECGESAVCLCGSAFTRASDGSAIGLGRCVQAACTTDADCEGTLCSVPAFSLCNVATRFQCQTAGDECAGAGDCPVNQHCEHDGTRFVCRSTPVCGRPFVVDGTARTAALAADGGWSHAAFAAAPGDLSSDERAAVARHFCEAGLMEHASIAAFARFSLQLLALGAPPDLVEETTRAMQDETRHALICFGLAERYGGNACGPGKLELAGALEATDLLGVADLVITEGCLGETSAALEAAWAAEAASDSALRDTLRSIAEDELRHAALAFRFVAWASRRDARVAELFSHRLAEARAEAAFRVGAQAGQLGLVSTRLARYGVLDEQTRAEARRRAIEDIVAPTARAATESQTTPREHTSAASASA